MDTEESGCWDWESWDRGIKKRVVQAGAWNGSAVQESSGVRLSIFDLVRGDPTITSDLIDLDNKEGIQKVEFVAGETDSHLDRLLDRLSRQMFVNETCRASFLQGKVEMSVRLEGYSLPEKLIYDWSVDEKLEKALQHKMRGDQLFKMKRIEDAIARYRCAVRLALFAVESLKENEAEGNMTTEVTDVAESKAESLLRTLCSNLTQFRLLNNQPELALQLSNKVLEKEKDNVKCLLRRGRAYFMLEEGEKSKEDLLRALKIEPNNQDARALLKATNHLISKQNETDARIAKRMLSLDV